jgi:hypothetical protein
LNAGPDLTDLQPACCRHLIAKFGQSERAQRREGQERAEHEARQHMERFPTHPGWGGAGRRRSEPGLQALVGASDVQAKLSSNVTYANFLGARRSWRRSSRCA